jgi:hypothetical protein
VNQTTVRPLRRYREAICFLVGALLLLLTWVGMRGDFSGSRGQRALVSLALLEAACLGAFFWLEHRRRRPAPARRWITLAWASLPVWVCIDVIVASLLRAGA